MYGSIKNLSRVDFIILFQLTSIFLLRPWNTIKSEFNAINDTLQNYNRYLSMQATLHLGSSTTSRAERNRYRNHKKRHLSMKFN